MNVGWLGFLRVAEREFGFLAVAVVTWKISIHRMALVSNHAVVSNHGGAELGVG